MVTIPLACSFALADFKNIFALCAMSQGRGWFDYDVTSYDVVPKNVQDKIIAAQQ